MLTLFMLGAIITKLTRERIDLEIHSKQKIKKFLTDDDSFDKI